MLFDLKAVSAGASSRSSSSPWRCCSESASCSSESAATRAAASPTSSASGNSQSTGNPQFDEQVEEAEAAAAADPEDEKALLELAQVATRRASSRGPTPRRASRRHRGREAIFEGALDAWEQYIALEPKKPDPSTAALVAQAYVQLEDATGRAEAQRIVAEDNPSGGTYGNLAFFLYARATSRPATRPGGGARRRLAQLRPRADQIEKQLAQFAKAAEGGQEGRAQAAEGGQPGGPSPAELRPVRHRAAPAARRHRAERPRRLPSGRRNRRYHQPAPGPLAQPVEQGPLKPKVEGSSPSRPTRSPRGGEGGGGGGGVGGFREGQIPQIATFGPPELPCDAADFWNHAPLARPREAPVPPPAPETDRRAMDPRKRQDVTRRVRGAAWAAAAAAVVVHARPAAPPRVGLPLRRVPGRE